MKAHDWFIEHRLDHVARALAPEDEALFRDHLARCAECTTAVREAERELQWLAMGTAPVAPRPGFTRRVVEEIAGPRPAAWRRWGWPVALAASAAAVFLGASNAARGRELATLRASQDSTVASYRDTMMAVLDTLSVLRQANRVLQASITMDGHQGGMTIFADETTHRWNVVVHGLPSAPSGEQYTFWFITGDGMVRGAELHMDGDRPWIATLGMPEGEPIIRGAALTVEPMDGDRKVPRGKELAHLML